MGGFVLGVAAGALLGVIIGIGIVVTGNQHETMNELRHACELHLPRNQNCIMHFVPEGETCEIKLREVE